MNATCKFLFGTVVFSLLASCTSVPATPQAEETAAPEATATAMLPTETVVPTFTPLPSPTPTPTLHPEQQALFDEALATLPESEFYALEVDFMDDALVARSPFDAPDSPHYLYQDGVWVDNHPGRNELESETFPEDLDDGTSIWKIFEKLEVVWDQERLAYRYPENSDIDPGHEEYFQPLMALIESDRADIEGGETTYAYGIKYNFVPGESGIDMKFFTSSGNPLKWWNVTDASAGASEARRTEVEEAFKQAMAEMYLEKFPELKGKSVIVRIVGEDRTHIGDMNTRDRTFFGGGNTILVDGWSGGSIDVNENLKLVTMTINTEAIKERPKNFAAVPHYALVWTLIVERDGKIISGGGHGMDSHDFVNGVIESVAEEVDISPLNMAEVETR